MEKQAQRYVGFDILKAICMFMVICIHAYLPGGPGGGLVAVCRIAVPVFFMITGFFYSGTVKNHGELRQLKKVFRLFLMGNAVFFLWNILRAVGTPGGDEVRAFLIRAFRKRSLFNFIVFNESPFGGHLWYLGALLYVLLIMMLAKRIGTTKALHVLAPFLLLADLALGKYTRLLLPGEVPVIWIRNFLFVGLPYFLTGVWFSQRRMNLPRSALLLSIGVFTMTTLIEWHFLGNGRFDTVRDHYLSTTFLAAAAFLFAMNASDRCGDTRIGAFLAKVGRRDAVWVYIFHPIVMVDLDQAARHVGVDGAYQYVEPFVVCACTLFAIRVFRWGFSGIRKCLHFSAQK